MPNVTDFIGRFAIVPVSAIQMLRGSPSSFIVYAVLAGHANRDNSEWTMSRVTIAEEAGVSMSTLKRCMAELRDLGLVEVTQNRTKDGDLGWSTYHLPRPDLDRGGVMDGPRSVRG